jgi:ubiquinone/menaquinone biosynthesis C-methylase UbiE
MNNELKAYYGKIFAKRNSVGCGCNVEHLHPDMEDTLKDFAPELLDTPHGSCSPLPQNLEGCTVLDLGCGNGRTAFAASRLVGSKGRVIGVDMREQLLRIAEKHLPAQMKKFGYKKSNTEFLLGYPEDLRALGIADNSIDVVVSNEIINISMDKRAVFSEIFRVLKPGGELCFTTVLADRRLPARLADDSCVLTAGFAGAMYNEDFRRLLRELGCHDYRNISRQSVPLRRPGAADKVGLAGFTYRLVRTFTLPLEDICEDYGQVAVYKGTMPGFPVAFPLDDHHLFIKDKPMLVCGNSGAMVEETRFGRHFTVTGDKSVHYGPFDCS